MPIKDILLHVDNSAACRERISVALKIADEDTAHLTGIYTYQSMIVPAYTEFGPPAYVYTEIEENNKQRAEEAKAMFHQAIGAWQKKTGWECYEGDRAINIARTAAHYDLVVMGQYNPDDESDDNRGVAEQVAISSGRPTLIVPHSGNLDHTGDRILIAWDGKKEAVRAVHDAMPFLKAAKAVEIANITRADSEEVPCAEIAAHLARHDIEVEAQSVRGETGTTGETILHLAQNFAADMIVMGAYGHSRFREMIIGGTTRHIMENAPLPVLMSH